jgi:hypothetical protein
MEHAAKPKGRSPSVQFQPLQPAPVVEEPVYCDGNRVIASLGASWDRVARLPRNCIKCGKPCDLESWTVTLVSQTRRLDQLIPIIKAHFYICHRHAKVARIFRWAGLAMLVSSLVLFLAPFGTRSFFSWNRAQDAVWVVAMSVLFGLGITIGGPWRGPLRLWKVRGEHVWITGTGRGFRSQLSELAMPADSPPKSGGAAAG